MYNDTKATNNKFKIELK